MNERQYSSVFFKQHALFNNALIFILDEQDDCKGKLIAIVSNLEALRFSRRNNVLALFKDVHRSYFNVNSD